MSLTREDYDVWAATYDAVDNPIVAVVGLALEETARAWGGARVLELGCGTARNAAAVLAAGAREYVGVDASAEMLARGRVRVGDDARVRLAVGDVTAAPREGFDVAMYCLVLEHFERLEAPLAAAAAALRDGRDAAIVRAASGVVARRRARALCRRRAGARAGELAARRGRIRARAAGVRARARRACAAGTPTTRPARAAPSCASASASRSCSTSSPAVTRPAAPRRTSSARTRSGRRARARAGRRRRGRGGGRWRSRRRRATRRRACGDRRAA